MFLEADVLKDCPAILSFSNCEDKEKAMAELISQKRKQNTNAANENTSEDGEINPISVEVIINRLVSQHANQNPDFPDNGECKDTIP